MAHPYEIMLILRPEGTDDHVKQILARAEELIKKEGVAIAANEPWGRRRLATPSQRQREGVYHVFKISAEPAAVARLQRAFRLDESTLRVLIVRAETPTATAAGVTAAAAPEREDWAR